MSRKVWSAQEEADLRRLYPDTPMPELVLPYEQYELWLETNPGKGW